MFKELDHEFIRTKVFLETSSTRSVCHNIYLSVVHHAVRTDYGTRVDLPTFYSVRGQLLDERLESESYAKEKVGRSNKHHFRLVVAVALIFIVVFMEAVVMILKRPVMRKIVDQKT